MAGRRVAILYVCLLAVLMPFSAAAQQERPRAIEDFSENSLIIASAKYLGATAESMAEIIDRIFSRYGTPSAIIRGEEISVSVMLGARYGRGTLYSPMAANFRYFGAAPQPVSIWARPAIKASLWFTILTNRKTYIAALPVLTARWSLWAASGSIICSAAIPFLRLCVSGSAIKSGSVSAI